TKAQTKQDKIEKEGDTLWGEIILSDPVAGNEYPGGGENGATVVRERTVEERQGGEIEHVEHQRRPAGGSGEGANADEIRDEGRRGEEPGPVVVGTQGGAGSIQGTVALDVVDNAQMLPGPGVTERAIFDGGCGVKHDDERDKVERRQPDARRLPI